MIYKNSTYTIEERVEDLLKHMTLDEKIGQLAGILPRVLCMDLEDLHIPAIVENGIGTISWINTPIQDEMAKNIKIYNALQRFLVENTRLGIPAWFCSKVISGGLIDGGVVYPQALAQRATFNTELVGDMGKKIHEHLVSYGIRGIHSPLYDTNKESRWNNTAISFGEGTFLENHMKQTFIDGVQQSDMMVINKDFLDYGVSEVVTLSDMSTKNEAISNVASTKNHNYFWELIKEGKIDMEIIDDAVKDVLHTKFVMGLFEEPYIKEGTYDFRDDKALAINLKLAEESQVLVKNLNSVLPLTKNKKIALIGPGANNVRGYFYSSIGTEELGKKQFNIFAEMGEENLDVDFMITYLQKNMPEIYRQIKGLTKDEILKSIQVIEQSIEKEQKEYKAIREEYIAKNYGDVPTLKEYFERQGHEVVYAEGCKYEDLDTSNFEEAKKQCQQADIIIAVMGEEDGMAMHNTIEINDKVVRLPGVQEELIRAVAECNKPMIGVMISSRPNCLTHIEGYLDAILYAFTPGEKVAEAIYNVIYGITTPSGKLPVEVPNHIEGIAYEEQYPLYSFGYGLSYTRFSIDDCEIKPTKKGIHVQFTIKNKGLYKGAEVVQVYSNKEGQASKKLIGFKKVALEPNEEQKVSFTIDVQAFGKQHFYIGTDLETIIYQKEVSLAK